MVLQSPSSVRFPTARMRRLRSTGTLREMVQETVLNPKDFIYPLFVTVGKGVEEPIDAMPGVNRISVDRLAHEARNLQALGIPAVLLFGPAAMLVTYWGGDPLGLMRECGHPLFLTVIGAAVWVAAHGGGRLTAGLAHPAVPWLQLPETLIMLWFTTLANAAPHPRAHHELDGLALAAHLGCLLAAALILARARPSGRPTFAA